MKTLVAALLLALPASSLARDLEEPLTDLRVSAQSGLLTFTGEGARYTSPGVAYGVTVGSDVTPWFSGELQYQGAAYGTDADHVPGNPAVVENGIAGMLRFGPQREAGAEPYVAGGFGIEAFDVQGDDDEGGPVQDATLLHVPFGVGIDYRVPDSFGPDADLLIGTRALYDVVFGGGPFDNAPGGDVNANRLQTTLQVGAQF
jgi:hypothetical protein